MVTEPAWKLAVVLTLDKSHNPKASPPVRPG